MDRARDLIEELDLTPEELHIKRRAEFDWWFDLPDVCLYEAVMLSLRVIPHSYYRLEVPLPTTHPPRYPDEFFFRLQRHLEDFHLRMALAVAAVKNGSLKGTRDTNFVNESERRVTLAKFEGWAKTAGVALPPEWRRKADGSKIAVVAPQQRREQNNLLRIIRALMRAAKIQNEASLRSIVAQAPLLTPPDQSAVMQALLAIPLADKRQEDMSPDEKKVARETPSPDTLIGIIAALAYADKRIDLRPRKSAAKRIAIYIDDDHHALQGAAATKPGPDTIEAVVRKIRSALIDADADKPN